MTFKRARDKINLGKVFVTDGYRINCKGAKTSLSTVWAVLPFRVELPFLICNYLLKEKHMKKIAIIMGSDSDLPIVEKGINVLKEYQVPFEVHVYSAHRTPQQTADFVKSARRKGFGAIIAAAGMAAHLAGAVAANTTLPVIGIPISCKNTGGVDALWSTVQMPTGIPVATVAIDGAANAAILAIEMLAITDKVLAKRLYDSRKSGEQKVLDKNKAIEEQYNA